MKLLILGTGMMANTHAEAFQAINGVELTACVDSRPDVAKAFAQKHGIGAVYHNVQDALAAGGFDACANVTPDAVHCSTTLECILAGVAVFCEKPLATNLQDANAMLVAANAAKVIHGLNLSYRNVSALQRAHSLVAEGVLGELRHFEASYLQSWLTQSQWGEWSSEPGWLWRLSSKHGSMGVLGDVGVHIFDFLTYASGADIKRHTSQLKTFDKAPGNRIGEYQLDANDSLLMTAELENGACGVVHASRFATGHLNRLSLSLHGTKGALRITNDGALGTLQLCPDPHQAPERWDDITLEPVLTNFERFAIAFQSGEPMRPDFQEGVNLQRVVDEVLAAEPTHTGVEEN